MTKQIINIGTAPNSKNGDSIRDAFNKVNSNFTELYTALTDGVNFTQVNTDWSATTGVAQILNKPAIPADVSDLTDITNLLGSGTANTDIYKFQYGVIGTKDEPDTGGWGGSAIVLDPGGESWAGMYIPSVVSQDSGGSLNIYNNKAVGNNIALSVNAGSFIFNGDGSLSFPVQPTNQRTGAGDALKFAKSSNQKVIATSKGTVDSTTVERLVIAGGDSYQDPESGVYAPYSEAGDIYLWAGRGANGGDIKVDAGNSQGVNGEEGGTIKVRGGYSESGRGGFVEISAGYSNQGQGGDVSIRAGGGTTAGTINLYTYGNTVNNWQFNPDGSLTLPPNSPLLFGNGNSRIQAGMGFHINSEEGISLGAVDVTDPENPITKGWYFATDGSLTFPDATVQTTAYKQGQHTHTLDIGTTDYAPTVVDFTLLYIVAAPGYSSGIPVTLTLPTGVPGQRLIIVYTYNVSNLTVNPGMEQTTVTSAAPAEFIYVLGEGWIALYGTV